MTSVLNFVRLVTSMVRLSVWPKRGVTGLLGVIGSLLLLATSGCVDGPDNRCRCAICLDAVTLTVQDVETDAAIEDFLVEVVHNDVVIGEPADCRADEREGANVCAFGREPGLYKIVIQAPDYETREATVRIGEEAPSEICCAACIRSREVTVSLQHL